MSAGVYRGSAAIEPSKAAWFYDCAREAAAGAGGCLNVVVHLVTKPSPGAQAAHMIASQKWCLRQVPRWVTEAVADAPVCIQHAPDCSWSGDPGGDQRTVSSSRRWC